MPMERWCPAAFCRSKSTKKMVGMCLNPTAMVGQNTVSFQKLFRSQEKVLYCINREVGCIICSASQQSFTWQKLLQKHIRKTVHSSQTYFNLISTQEISSAQCWGELQWVSWPRGCLNAQRISSMGTAACWRWQDTRNQEKNLLWERAMQF